MKLTYTGAPSYLAIQPDPNLSLGGFLSSTVIANNKMNNIFPDLSIMSVQNKRTDCRAIILENDEGTDWINLKVGFKYRAEAKNYMIELALVNLNPTNPEKIEKIPDGSSSPYYANFSEAFITDTENNSIEYGDFADAKKLAIWIRRTIINSQPVIPDGVTDIDFYKNLEDDVKNYFDLVLNFDKNV